MGDKFANTVGALITVALVTAIVSRRNSAAIIRESGRAFATSIRAALGR